LLQRPHAAAADGGDLQLAGKLAAGADHAHPPLDRVWAHEHREVEFVEPVDQLRERTGVLDVANLDRGKQDDAAASAWIAPAPAPGAPAASRRCLVP
jgi:hypothetical protein